MTWVFLGGLAGAVIAMGVVAARTDRNTIPVDIDSTWQSIAAFYRTHPHASTEVDLGKGWTSALDPGAAIALSWSDEGNELRALRRQALPDMTALGGVFSSVPSSFGTSRKTGMKVLAVADLDDLRLLGPHTLEGRPDGLDQLTALLGAPYVAPDPVRFGLAPANEARAARPAGPSPAPGAPVEVGGPAVAEDPVVLVIARDPRVRHEIGAPRAYATGTTVRAALDDLARRKPAAASIVTADGTLRDDVVIYLGDPNRGVDPHRYTRDLDTQLGGGDTVTIDAAPAHRP